MSTFSNEKIRMMLVLSKLKLLPAMPQLLHCQLEINDSSSLLISARELGIIYRAVEDDTSIIRGNYRTSLNFTLFLLTRHSWNTKCFISDWLYLYWITIRVFSVDLIILTLWIHHFKLTISVCRSPRKKNKLEM